MRWFVYQDIFGVSYGSWDWISSENGGQCFLYWHQRAIWPPKISTSPK
jgi:hypothetical protein